MTRKTCKTRSHLCRPSIGIVPHWVILCCCALRADGTFAPDRRLHNRLCARRSRSHGSRASRSVLLTRCKHALLACLRGRGLCLRHTQSQALKQGRWQRQWLARWHGLQLLAHLANSAHQHTRVKTSKHVKVLRARTLALHIVKSASIACVWTRLIGSHARVTCATGCCTLQHANSAMCHTKQALSSTLASMAVSCM